MESISELQLLARMTRRRAHDRDAELAAQRDEAEESGDAARYHAACVDIAEDLEDDLWMLIEAIEQAMAQQVGHGGTDGAADPAGPMASAATPGVVSPAARAARERDAWEPRESGVPQAWRYEAAAEAELTAEADAEADSAEWSASGRQIRGHLPAMVYGAKLASHAIDAGIPAALAGAVDGTAEPTIALRVQRDSDEFRAMFDPRGRQFTVMSIPGGCALTVADLACIATVESGEVFDEPPYVCVAAMDDADSTAAYVLTGRVAGLAQDGDDLAVCFEDGAAVPHAAIMGMKIG